jgi:hypothetical protein
MHRCLKELEFSSLSDMHCGAKLYGSLCSILLENVDHVLSRGFTDEKPGDESL